MQEQGASTRIQSRLVNLYRNGEPEPREESMTITLSIGYRLALALRVDALFFQRDRIPDPSIAPLGVARRDLVNAPKNRW